MKSSEENRPPPMLTEPALAETLRHSAVDMLMLCFFAVVLKLWRSEILRSDGLRRNPLCDKIRFNDVVTNLSALLQSITIFSVTAQ